MEYLEGFVSRDKIAAAIQQAVLMANTLHKNGLVYGDLCTTNILWRSGEVRFVDFNWAGEDGEAKYCRGKCHGRAE